MKKESKRFHPSRPAQVLVPVLLALILLGLLASLVLIGLAVFGIIPSG